MIKLIKGIYGGLGIVMIIGGFGNFVGDTKNLFLGILGTVVGIMLLPIPTFEKRIGEAPVLIAKMIIFLFSMALAGNCIKN